MPSVLGDQARPGRESLIGPAILKLTIMVNEALEDAALVLEHLQLTGGIETMLGGDEGREAGLDVGLLREELADGGVDISRGSELLEVLDTGCVEGGGRVRGRS